MMNRLRAYRIAFRGLGEGKHVFAFALDAAFFDCFEATKGTRGRVEAEVCIVKGSALMEVKIRLSGTVLGICDRCLGEVEVPVEGGLELYVKQSGREEGNGDDFIVVSPEDDFLDLGPYLYETYMLHYPLRVVHPDGKCDGEMQKILDEHLLTDN